MWTTHGMCGITRWWMVSCGLLGFTCSACCSLWKVRDIGTRIFHHNWTFSAQSRSLLGIEWGGISTLILPGLVYHFSHKMFAYGLWIFVWVMIESQDHQVVSILLGGFNHCYPSQNLNCCMLFLRMLYLYSVKEHPSVMISYHKYKMYSISSPI